MVGLTYEKDKYVAENQDWEQAYQSINACNSLLSEAGKLTPANEREALEIERVKGEAAFLRALYYFELVNLYGKPYCSANLAAPAIPLKLSVMVEDRDYTCATVSEVYEQILKDLETAETSLARASVKSFPYRADITAVYLLKSRVLLYMQDWKNALEYADKTLKNKQELLDLTSFNGDEVLGESSPETIFSMGGYVMAYSIHPIRGMKDKVWKNLPNYIISEDLLQAFEEEGENDLRSRHYICKDTLGSLEVPYVEAWIFRKVRGWENASTRNISDNFLFRTAEAYLNGAEAAALAAAPEKGSIIMLLATDAPLDVLQLGRLARRAGNGLARTGSLFGHGSGDVAIAFSSSQHLPQLAEFAVPLLHAPDGWMDRLFQAAAEATEQAIFKALFFAEPFVGRDGHRRPSIQEVLPEWCDIVRS